MCKLSCDSFPECIEDQPVHVTPLQAPYNNGVILNRDGNVALPNGTAVKQKGPPARQYKPGIVSFSADLTGALIGPPLRCGEVWHLLPEDKESFEVATLALHRNGIAVTGSKRDFIVTWSPFSLVQACRLHSVQADRAMPWLRLFKVSVFQHGSTHFFAARGNDADTERARWVADIARALRLLTQSLFPNFDLRSEPLAGCEWTTHRLLAGYLLLCDDQGVSLVYCELHSHWDGVALFLAYEDDTCEAQVVQINIDANTCVSERVGVDCSCFSFDNYHFTTRTCSEKMLWLRAISNVKVKLRHRAPNPTMEELRHYRFSVLNHAKGVQPLEEGFTRVELLPRRSRIVHKTYKSAEAQPTPALRLGNAKEATAVDTPKLQDLPAPKNLSVMVENIGEEANNAPPPFPGGEGVNDNLNLVPSAPEAKPTAQPMPARASKNGSKLPTAWPASQAQLKNEGPEELLQVPMVTDHNPHRVLGSETAPPDAAAGPTEGAQQSPRTAFLPETMTTARSSNASTDVEGL